MSAAPATVATTVAPSAPQLRIVQMASMARSGETLVLRTFNAHPLVHVVHDLRPGNTSAELRLFNLLRVWPGNSLPRWQLDEHVVPGAIDARTRVLLIKQGVFAPRHDFDGFGLVRNPYASFSSLWSYDARQAGRGPDAALNALNWRALRLPRLVAWCDAMLPQLVPALRQETDPVRQFLMFWQARVAQIVARCPLVLPYEDLTDDPEHAMRSLCMQIDLPFEPAMLQAHQRFAPGTKGHGGIDLGAPIRRLPAWSPDPLVDIAPFAHTVSTCPIGRYRGLYDTRATS